MLKTIYACLKSAVLSSAEGGSTLVNGRTFPRVSVLKKKDIFFMTVCLYKGQRCHSFKDKPMSVKSLPATALSTLSFKSRCVTRLKITEKIRRIYEPF